MSVMWVSAESILALTLREVAAIHGRTGLGYFWAVLEPVLTTSVICLILGFIIKSPPIGDSFVLFYATGLMPFLFVIDAAQKTGQSLAFSRPLLHLPRISFLDAILARFGLAIVTHALIWGLVLAAIKAAGVDLRFEPFEMLLAWGVAAFFAFGLGCFICLASGMLLAWPRIWAILVKPLFFASGVFFLIDDLPDPFREYFLWNPLSQVISLFRAAHIEGYSAELVSVFYIFLCSSVLGILGLAGLLQTHRRIVEEWV